MNAKTKLFLSMPAGAVALFMVLGCASVRTESVRPFDAQKPQGGIPYHLPAGLVTVTVAFPLSAGAEQRVVPTVTVKESFYPDTGATYLLEPSQNAFFGTKHTISVSNGLLQSVSTTDESGVKDAVLAVAQTAVNVAKLKVGAPLLAQGGTDAVDIFLNDSRYPTEAEIAFALQSVAGSSVAVQLDSAATHALQPMAVGSSGLLTLTAQMESVSGTANAGSAKSSVGLNQAEGVYTRSLQPYIATVDLRLNVTELRRLRRNSYRKAIKSLSEAKEKSERFALRDQNELSRLRGDLDQLIATARPLQAKANTLQEELQNRALTGDARTNVQATWVSLNTLLAELNA